MAVPFPEDADRDRVLPPGFSVIQGRDPDRVIDPMMLAPSDRVARNWSTYKAAHEPDAMLRPTRTQMSGLGVEFVTTGVAS